MIKRFWSGYNVETKTHFYHNGGNIENRHSIVEALIFNFDVSGEAAIKQHNEDVLAFAV